MKCILKKFFILFCITVLLVYVGMAATEQADVSIVNEDDSEMCLVFKGGGLKKPLRFTLTGENGVFFEVNHECITLKDTPDFLQVSEDKVVANWSIAQREISMNIERTSMGFEVSLTSSRGDIERWGVNLSLDPDEFITGLTERVVDGVQFDSWKEGITEAMNINGQSFDMRISGTLSIYTPFFLSSRGYGLFVRGTWPGKYDIGESSEDRMLITFEGPSMEYEISISDSPMELVEHHSLRVGPSLIPPKWVFGQWRWRDEHYIQSEYYDGSPSNAPYNTPLVEDILMMEALDIPCSVYWIDRPWAISKGDITERPLEKGFCDYEWDGQRFPDSPEMIDWLERKGMKLLLWAAPFVAGEMNEVAKANGYDMSFYKGAGERVKSSDYVSMIDFTNETAREWWQANGPAKVLNDGVKGFKLDRADKFVPWDKSIFLYNGRSARENANDYPRQYVKAAYDICSDIHGDDFILLARAAYSGSSKYAAFWGGDTGSGPLGLRSAIIAQARSAIIGFPIWGSDTGGYDRKSFDRQDIARWLAFSCFSPIMEVGPTKNTGFWNMPEAPVYDAELLAIWRFYAKVHTSLIDYSHDCAKIAHEKGTPIVRPLFLLYPEQEEAWKSWDTYLYGPDILVAAIWERGTSEHQVYLPEGEAWMDAWEPEKVYQGGQIINVTTPIYKIPIFLRKRSKVMLYDLQKLYMESKVLCEKRPDIRTLELQEFGQ